MSSPPRGELKKRRSSLGGEGGSPIGVVSTLSRSNSQVNVEEEPQTKTIYLKVKFPPDYPFDMKVVCLDPDCNVTQALRAIQSAYKLPRSHTIGLYSPEAKNWLSEKSALKDIDLFKDQNQIVEYRDKKNPVNLGDLRARRKTQSLNRKTSSPFFQQWESAFKDIIRKKEETKRRESTLRHVLSSSEIEDMEKRLTNLAEARHDNLIQKKGSHKRSPSVDSISDKHTQYDELVQKLKQREEDARLAAEIGKGLLEKNADLMEEIKEFEDREKDFKKVIELNAQLEDEIVRLTSRCMFLETQTDEAKETNKALIQEITDMGQVSKIRPKSVSTPETFADSEQLEILKKELAVIRATEDAEHKELTKVRAQRDKLNEQLKEMEAQLDVFKREVSEVDSLKEKLSSLTKRNKMMEKRLNKAVSQRDLMQDRSTESMLEQIEDLVQRTSLYDTSKETEQKLLEQCKKLIEKLRSASDKKESIVKQLLAMLQQSVTKLSTASKKEEDLAVEQLQGEAFEEMSNLYFLLSIFSLVHQEQLEQNFKKATNVQHELQEDLSEIRNKYDQEHKAKEKLEEKLEVAERELMEIEKNSEERFHKLEEEKRAEIEDLRKRLAEWAKQRDVQNRVNEETASMKQKNIALTSELETLRTAHETTKRNFEAALVQLESEQSQSATMKKENEELKTQLLKTLTEYDQTLKKHTTMKQQFLEAIKKVDGLEKQHRDRMQSIETKVQNGQKQVDRMKLLVDKLLQDLIKNREIRDNYKKQIETLNIDIQTQKLLLVEKIQELQKSTELLEKERQDLKPIESKLVADVTELRNVVLAASDSKTLRLGDLHSELEMIKKSLTEKDKSGKEVNLTITELQETIQSKDQLAELLQKQNEKLLEEVQALQLIPRENKIETEMKKLIQQSVVEDKFLGGIDQMYVDYVNELLAGEKSIEYLLPVGYKHSELVRSTQDGVLFCKMINLAQPGEIDERVLKLNSKNTEDMEENHNLVINSALGIGVNQKALFKSEDLIQGKVDNIMKFLKELVYVIVMSKVSIVYHPELKVLVGEGEKVSHVLSMAPEILLLRWANYHLKRAGGKAINNFAADVKDGAAYLQLFSQIAPDFSNKDIFNEKDAKKRVENVIFIADKLKCRKFASSEDIIIGDERINQLFAATVFHALPGLKIEKTEVQEVEKQLLTISDEGSREERAFQYWVNSLGIQMRNMNDMTDGIIILKILDFISPGIVQWNRVSLNPSNNYKKIENGSYCVELSKKLFKIENIGGKDIFEGNTKLLLALLWQCMRYHFFQILKRLKSGGKEITESDMIAWANAKVKSAGKSSQMQSFKDSALSDSVFLIDLLHSIKPGCIDYSLVTAGTTQAEKMMNAKYAINVARKIGCCIFLLWEDIVEVKPKMVLTFVGSLMIITK